MANIGSHALCFVVLVLLAEVVGLTSVVMVAVWMGHFLNGYSWNEPSLVFNYHPLFMIIGMVFLNGNALLSYRVFTNTKKTYVKVIHASLLICSLIFSIIGLKAVFDFHNNEKFPNLYSLHSWLGLIAVILFCLQWLFGFVSFLWPKLSESIRRFVMPYHIYMGLFVFCLSIGVALMGITEKAIFSMSGKSYPSYSARPPAAYVANFLGLFLVILGSLIVFIVTRDEFKRPSLDEEHAPLHE